MSWKSIADLLGGEGEVALLGAPMEAGSVTPGRCDLAPGGSAARRCGRFSTYDIDTGRELAAAVHDRGDAAGRRAVRRPRASSRSAPRSPRAAKKRLTLLLGGNNAVTRPAAARPGRAAGKCRADHLRRPFRHARDRQGAEQRQSGPLPAGGRPARLEHLPDRPRPLGQYRRRCTATRRRRASASSPSPTARRAASTRCSTRRSPASSTARC